MSSVLSIRNLAQIQDCTITFGDLTLLIGPQASGKSITLQMLKLVVDRQNIASTLRTNGYDWAGKSEKFLELFLGEGMGEIWKTTSEVTFGGKKFQADSFLPKKGRQVHKDSERLFYVIAQRVVTMYQGWPRAFGAFDIGDPYVLKSFGETLRLLMEREALQGNGPTDQVFPRPGRMMEPLRALIDQSIFHGAKVELDRSSLKKRFMLHLDQARLPFMTWSAGQKEFMPLLLALYHLLPPSKVTRRDDIEWVVIEEPEMGLHPQAIRALMVVFLELIQRGYKVVVSTHSPVLLELAWTMREIQKFGGDSSALYELFGLPKNPSLTKIFNAAIKDKTFSTYYFDRQANDRVQIQDISSLDAGSEDANTANWGGISEFAGRAIDVVTKLAARAE